MSVDSISTSSTLLMPLVLFTYFRARENDKLSHTWVVAMVTIVAAVTAFLSETNQSQLVLLTPPHSRSWILAIKNGLLCDG